MGVCVCVCEGAMFSKRSGLICSLDFFAKGKGMRYVAATRIQIGYLDPLLFNYV